VRGRETRAQPVRGRETRAQPVRGRETRAQPSAGSGDPRTTKGRPAHNQCGVGRPAHNQAHNQTRAQRGKTRAQRRTSFSGGRFVVLELLERVLKTRFLVPKRGAFCRVNFFGMSGIPGPAFATRCKRRRLRAFGDLLAVRTYAGWATDSTDSTDPARTSSARDPRRTTDRGRPKTDQISKELASRRAENSGSTLAHSRSQLNARFGRPAADGAGGMISL